MVVRRAWCPIANPGAHKDHSRASHEPFVVQHVAHRHIIVLDNHGRTVVAIGTHNHVFECTEFETLIGHHPIRMPVSCALLFCTFVLKCSPGRF